MKHWLIILTLASVLSCREPFEPTEVQSLSTIVVDGLITNESKQHVITISKSSPIDSNQFIPVEGALVQLIENGSTTFVLSEFMPGMYRTFPFSGKVGSTYQLVIEAGGGRYQSTLVTLKATPEISEIKGVFATQESGQRGIQVVLNTTDPSNSSNFFRWEWVETFEVRSPYPRRYEWLGGNELLEVDLVPATRCWQTDSSNQVLIASTSGLESATVNSFEIRFIPESGQELVELYSIEVRQFALDQEAFSFWQVIREIGERQGSIFDLQPGLVTGNMSSIDGEGLILGYFDAAQVQTQRVFFQRGQFNADGLVRFSEFQANCTASLDTIPPVQLAEYMSLNGEEKNVIGFLQNTGFGWLIGPKECTDCRFQGSSEKPDFWP